jgi:hypothetical protein
VEEKNYKNMDFGYENQTHHLLDSELDDTHGFVSVLSKSTLINLPKNGFETTSAFSNYLEFLVMGCPYVSVRGKPEVACSTSTKRYRLGIMVNHSELKPGQKTPTPNNNTRYVIYCELLGAEDFDVDLQSLASIECREKVHQLQSQINFMNEDY